MFEVNKGTRTTPLTTYFTSCSSVSIANFEYVIAGRVKSLNELLNGSEIVNEVKLPFPFISLCSALQVSLEWMGKICFF